MRPLNVAEMTLNEAIRSSRFTSKKVDEMAIWYPKAAEQGDEFDQLMLAILRINRSRSFPKLQLGLGPNWVQGSA